MPKSKNTTCMSLKDTTKDVDSYLPQSVCNCWASQEMWNFRSKKPVAKVMVEEGEMDIFLQFLDEDAVIQEFLKKDTCSLLADKYLLAMVFTYFKRAQYTPQEFTRYNFFVALFLAHNIEEDDDYKSELYIWALGFRWMQHYQELHTSIIVLWRVMDYRGIVSRACCEKVMSLRPDHPIWRRNRDELYAGANRPYVASSNFVSCNYCELKSDIKSDDSSIFQRSDDSDSISSDSSRDISQSLVDIREFSG